MRAVAVALTVAVAACSARVPDEPPVPPGKVVLARFTGEVDLAAGTFEIRNDPVTPGGDLRGGLVTLDADVTVANKGGSFFSDSAVVACPDASGGHTWGATVQVTNKSATTRLSGVYAEITTFGGSIAALGSCSNNAVVPNGTTSANGGLWSYDLLAGSGTGEVQWVFKYATATRFTFSGRIVGTRLETVTLGGGHTPLNTDPGSIASTGTSLLVASQWNAGANFGIEFVDPATLAVTQTVTTPGKVTSIATSASLIWYITQPDAAFLFHVGYMNTDGTGHVSSQVNVKGAETGSMSSGPIVADPAGGTRAWFTYCENCTPSTTQSISAIRAFTTGGGLSAGFVQVNTLRFRPLTNNEDYLEWMVPVGSTLWVTTLKGLAADAYVKAFDITNDPAALVGAQTTSASPCNGSPYVIVSGPGSLLYFGDTGATGRVCSFAPGSGAAGTVTEIASAKGPAGTTSFVPYDLAVTGTAGSESVWESLNDTAGNFTGVYGLNANLRVRTTSGSSQGATWPIHAFAGYLWTADNAGLYRVQY